MPRRQPPEVDFKADTLDSATLNGCANNGPTDGGVNERVRLHSPTGGENISRSAPDRPEHQRNTSSINTTSDIET